MTSPNTIRLFKAYFWRNIKFARQILEVDDTVEWYHEGGSVFLRVKPDTVAMLALGYFGEVYEDGYGFMRPSYESHVAPIVLPVSTRQLLIKGPHSAEHWVRLINWIIRCPDIPMISLGLAVGTPKTTANHMCLNAVTTTLDDMQIFADVLVGRGFTTEVNVYPSHVTV